MCGMGASDLRPKVADLLVLSTSDPEFSQIDEQHGYDVLAMAAIDVMLKETNSASTFLPKIPAHSRQAVDRVASKLKFLLEEEFDSDYGSSRGSEFSCDFENYYKDFKTAFSSEELSFRVSHL